MKWTAQLRRFARKPPSDRSAPPNPGAPGIPQGGRRLLTGRTWLWFAAIILLNFAIAKLLVPEPDAPLSHSATVRRLPPPVRGHLSASGPRQRRRHVNHPPECLDDANRQR